MTYEDQIKAATELGSVTPSAALSAEFYSYINSKIGSDYPGLIRYTPGDEQLPVAIILHDYRGDSINGAAICEQTQILSDAGFPVMQMNYTGFDHYGDAPEIEMADPATLDTNIADYRMALDFLNERGQSAIVVANSYSINVALQALKDNVDHIIAVAPAPDFLMHRYAIPSWEETPKAIVKKCANLLNDQGYFFHPPERRQVQKVLFGEVRLKYTQAFLNSAVDFESRLALNSAFDDFSAAENKPGISIIGRFNDVTAGKDTIGLWLNHMAQFGFIFRDLRINGQSHSFEGLNKIFGKEARFLRRSILSQLLIAGRDFAIETQGDETHIPSPVEQ